MTERDQTTMGEAEFDRLLESGLPELPPDDVVKTVTPWRKAMNRALTGLALALLSLNGLGLNYILPYIGALLALLGFRALRRENRPFRVCWIVMVIRCADLFLTLIADTTIWHTALEDTPAMKALSYVMLALGFVQTVCLWRGFRAVQAKAGVEPHADGAVGLVVWFAILCVLGLMEYSGPVLGWVMLISYFFIFRGLYKLSKQLDEAGWSITPAPVRVSDRALVLAVTIPLAVGMTLGYVFGGTYPMEWTPADPDEHARVEDIRANLLDLGYPEELLNDLSPEDLAACEGATQVLVVKTKDYPVNEGREVRRQVGGATQISREYDVNELRLTCVAVELPPGTSPQFSGALDQWRLFHHFQWVADPGFWGTESIQLWPTWRGNRTTGWVPGGELTGRVLYDKDGVTYTAPYWSLESETFTSDSVFWGSATYTDPFAAFSFPRSGENRRGYLTYSNLRTRVDYTIDSWVNYTHQLSPFQYPVQTAKEYRQSGVWGNTLSAFKTVQDQMWFYPKPDGETP